MKVLATAMALLASAGLTTPKWTLLPDVPIPAAATASQLQGVTVVSPTDAWTAGAWSAGSVATPLLAHWDGTAWAVPALPVLPADTYLSSVDALGPSDVWAAGNTDSSGTDPASAVASVLHYDGVSWQSVAVPVGAGSVGAGSLGAGSLGAGNEINALDMRTPGDGWAVGETTSATGEKPLILHWNGTTWASVPAPKSALGSGLYAVSARSATDVWAAGDGVVLHFDGLAWTQFPAPLPSGTSLDAVAAIGPADVWISGKTCASTCTAAVWHLTLLGWVPVSAAGGTEASSIVAFSPGDLWILGYQSLTGGAKADFVEHWNGRTMTREDTGLAVPTAGDVTPNGLASATPLYAAAGDPVSGELFAVGWSSPPAVTPRVIHRG